MKDSFRTANRSPWALLILAFLIPALPARAIVKPKADSPLDRKAFRHPDLYIRQGGKSVDVLPPALSVKARADLGALQGQIGYYDVRSGRWSLLVLSRPLIPVSGQVQRAARDAVLAYVTQYQSQLGISPSEVAEPRVSVHSDGRLVQVHAQRVVNGLPVRDSWLKATFNAGNLVLLGTQNWGSVGISPVAAVSARQAEDRVRSYASDYPIISFRSAPELTIVPFSKGGKDVNQVPLGDGLNYRLAWVVSPVFAHRESGTWEGLVDAHTGEMLAFEDINQYFTRKVMGGIFPVSNDGAFPDGQEQPDFPMPYAYVLDTDLQTNSAGMVSGTGSQVRTNLTGPYIRMTDTCGVADESALCTDLNLGLSSGTDCVVPAGHSTGDTHAARTGFYELNRQVEGWRSRLPEGSPAGDWVRQQLTSNMNINDQCNANWDGSSINFFRSGGGCANTGEIAAVFDHEWGHGVDNNNADPSISSPGEAIADIYGLLRLTDQCFGRGFFITANGGLCGGYGNPCTTCSGVRGLDFNEHECKKPFDITWINQVGYPVATPCTALTNQGGCVGFNFIQTGPCGEETHCEGNVPAQAVYDLFARDLAAAPFSLDFNTRLEIVTRLVAVAQDNLANWYVCSQGSGGCSSITGYMLFLAADDDNGNLMDGTPHMSAIFNAFNRHGIACPLPAAVDGGCVGGPMTAPTLTAVAGPNAASLSWNAVPGATKYTILRTEGVKGCNLGKVKVGETVGNGATSFTDTGLRDGFSVLYTVAPVGATETCVGPMAACQSVTPTATPAGAEAYIAEIPNGLSIGTGDGDVFLDNCEQATLTFRVENSGAFPLTNVRVTGVELVGKPASDIITPLPLAVAATIPVGCPPLQPAQASVTFRPQGLASEETLEVRIQLTADELAEPVSKVIRISGTESDFQLMASKTFSFETDFERWKIVDGTYTRMPPGANGTVNALYSSSAQDSICDEIRSPEIRLRQSSTLSLFNQFATEPPQEPGGPYDRANVGLFVEATGTRTTVAPSSGKLYDIPTPTSGGTCVTAGQAGWAGVSPFMSSTFNAAALAPAGCVGQRCRIDIAYGTDSLVSGSGFDFDEVTLTNFELQVPDQASNTCGPLARPDLQVTSIAVNNNRSVREGDKVTIQATVKNTGNAPAAASTTEFRLDNTTILGAVATQALNAGASATLSIQWDTRSQKGTHTIRVTADAGIPPTVTESNENNNSSTITVDVKGNKVKNSSFEQGNSSGNGPDGWSGSSTGAGDATWSDGGSDGSRSAATSGNGGNAASSGSPSWTSDPITVTPGENLSFVVSVNSVGASSAATAGLAYLGAAGQLLNSVTLVTAPLATSGFTTLQQTVTIPAGVTQVRVRLVGFSQADLRTSGTVRFDEVGLFAN